MADNGQLAVVIGRNAKTFRTRAGLTLNDVSIAARKQGLEVARVAGVRVQRGAVAANLGTLVAVCLALNDAGCEDATLPALVDYGGGPIRVNERLALYDFDIQRLLQGKPLEAVPTAEDPTEEDLAAEFTTIKTAWERWIAGTLDVDLATIVRVKKASGAAEERVRKSIGISSMLLAHISASLWGNTFSAERDRRAGEGANAQKRGQITRAMRQELEREIREREEGGPRRRGNRM